MGKLKTIPLSEYISTIMSTSKNLRMFLYNIKSEIPELVDDIIFPTLIDSLSRNFIFMFFGCKGSVTQMHFDIDMSHVFHTAMYGKKTVYNCRIIRAGKLLYGHGKANPVMGWYSPTYNVKEAAISIELEMESRIPITITSEWQFPEE